MREDIKKRLEMVRNSEVPEGYVETMVGIIPSAWSSAPLSEVSTILSEQAGDREFETLSISAGIGFVNQAEKFGKELSGKQYTKYTVLRRGDFAYNKGNSKRYPQGCTYMLRERDEAAVPNVFECFRIIQGHPEYYEQLFINGFMNKQLTRKINHGVRDDGLLNLTDDDFYSTIFPVPPLAEQQKIAEILATCDRVIELKRQLLEEKRRQKKWLMQKLLDPDSGVRVPGFESSVWKEHRLGEFGCCIRGVSYDPKKDLAEEKTSNTTTLFRANNIGVDGLLIDGIQFVSSEKVSKNQLIKPGDIAISMSSGSKKAVGKTIYIGDGYDNGCFGAFCAIFRSDANDFIKHLFESRRYQQHLSIILEGTNICNLTNGDIEDLVFWFPENDLERKKVTDVLSAADQQILALSQELEAWQQKKKALMQLLLTGLVRVNA